MSILKLASIYCFASKTLYHGTSLKRAKQIMHQGLIPQIGSWVQSTYGSEIDFDDDDFSSSENSPIYDLIFAADKSTISKAVGGIIGAIAGDENKAFHDVSNEDIINKGAILVMYDAQNDWEQKPSNQKDMDKWEQSHFMPTVEPADYFRTKSYLPDRLLSGQPMIRLLKKYNAFPIMTDPNSPEKFKPNLINYLFNNSNMPIQEIIQKVNNMSEDEIISFMYQLSKD